MSAYRNTLCAALVGLGLLAASQLVAQTGAVDFGGLVQDTSEAVEITADELTVDQATGKATFVGNVVIIQGAMRLGAGTVEVVYGEEEKISRLVASGGVTFATESDAAEADSAEYDLETGEVVLTGNVLVTQGPNAISGNRIVIDLDTGTGRVDGRVRTVIQPGGNQ